MLNVTLKMMNYLFKMTILYEEFKLMNSDLVGDEQRSRAAFDRHRLLELSLRSSRRYAATVRGAQVWPGGGGRFHQRACGDASSGLHRRQDGGGSVHPTSPTPPSLVERLEQNTTHCAIWSACTTRAPPKHHHIQYTLHGISNRLLVITELARLTAEIKAYQV